MSAVTPRLPRMISFRRLREIPRRRARLENATRLAHLHPVNDSIGDELQGFVVQRRQRFLLPFGEKQDS